MTLHKVTKQSGIAGQFAVTAEVDYPGEERQSVTFVGSSYGGPVVMRINGAETFVHDPGRFGEFGVDWVRRFFA